MESARGWIPGTAAVPALAWCLAPILLGLALPVPAGTEPDVRAVADPHVHAANCVAALKPVASMLADQLRAGDTSVQSELLKLTESGFSFIGVAYKSGLRKEAADKMLAEAEEAQRSLSDAARAQLAADCRIEGDKLLADANALERALVEEAAKRRVRRLLEK